MLKAARWHKRRQTCEEGELRVAAENSGVEHFSSCVSLSCARLSKGTSQAELVGALKEAMGTKTKEFVHVDLDKELDKLGLKAAFPLDLWPPSMAVPSRFC